MYLSNIKLLAKMSYKRSTMWILFSALFWYLAIPTTDGAPHESIRRLCGLQQYNPNNQLCCSGQLYGRHSEGVEQKCCGGKTYSDHSAICCQSNAVERSSLHRYINPECCGGNIYSNTNASEDLTQPNACCGNPAIGLSYNSKAYYCCGGMLTRRTPESIMGCCCGRPFEQQLGASYGRECVNCSIQEHRLQQCGDKSYNPASHVCCGNKDLKAVPMDEFSSLEAAPVWTCVEGQVINRNLHSPDRTGLNIIPTGTDTCGQVIYVKHESIICCKGKQRKVASDNVECCQATGELYDTTIQSCCAGQVIQLGLFGCCNNEIYNDTYHDCCHGLKIFNNDKQVCCLNQYSIVLTDLGTSPKNMTRLKGVVLSPKRHRGDRVEVRTPYKCHCFEKEALYLIDTNKRMRPMRHQRRTLRLTSKDKMVPETQKSPCLIYNDLEAIFNGKS
ncbi:GXN-like protein [Mya arenaria]|uniref:GXN-like protein n=1 Tax=Mya arenaria TaxID=6604 RepID=A0ABY7FE13_MYAAR|nr:GXN-like protein [Mya arenaria]